VKRLNNSNLSQLIEGAISARNNDYAGSLSAFMKAHEVAPNDIQPILAIVRTYLSKKNFKEALVFLDGEVVKSPNNNQVRLLLAQVAGASGDVNRAKDAYQAAIKSNPKLSAAYQQLAYLHLSKADNASARNVVEQGLAQIPSSFDLEMVSAEIYQSEKAYDKALAVYEKLMKSNPDSEVAVNNYVSIVADSVTDKAKLENAYQSAQRLKTSNVPQFLDTLGWISYRVGKYDEALPLLDKAIKSAPDYAIFHYHLGKVLIAKQENAKAKQHFEKALELNKGQNVSYSADIKEMLKTI
jgi:tetratricopeptide (TPR) repeat protein